MQKEIVKGLEIGNQKLEMPNAGNPPPEAFVGRGKERGISNDE